MNSKYGIVCNIKPLSIIKNTSKTALSDIKYESTHSSRVLYLIKHELLVFKMA